MSGVAKAVGKVFKKVAEPVKKILPFALAGAAVFFTAGAALGVTPAFGGAVAGLVSNMGASGTLANVLTGAITQAGYGAAIGTATSAAMGGDIQTGATIGALGGAATGGLTGAMGMPADPMAQVFEKSAPAGADTLAGSAGADTLASGAGPATAGPSTGAPIAGQSGGGLMSGAGAGVDKIAQGGGLFGQGGWLERNQMLAGQMVGGLGQGLLSGADAEAYGKAALERDREERRAIAANYGSGLVPGYRDYSSAPPAKEYRYNVEKGRIELVDREAA